MTQAHEYAEALFSLSEQTGTTEATLTDLKVADAALKENPSYLRVVDTPALPRCEKQALIQTAFASLSHDVQGLLSLLCSHHAVYLFPQIMRQYAALYDEARGIERAQVITAVALTPAQQEALTQRLSRLTGKTVLLESTVDPTLLGGARLRFAGTQLDASLRTRLDRLNESLKSAIL